MSNVKLNLLTPDACTLILVDYQPQMVFGVASMDRQLLFNNVIGLAKAARVFNVPTVLTAVQSKTFSGAMWPELVSLFPRTPVIERTSMNAWDSTPVVASATSMDRNTMIFAGLWTEVCVVFPVLDALAAGHQVYFVTDASAGTSYESHHMAIERMIQAGATPLTWLQLALEWQRDWARRHTYDALLEVLKAHAGAYGQGIEYAQTMLPGAPADDQTP